MKRIGMLAGLSLLQSLCAFSLQVELLRRFVADAIYLDLLAALNLTLPIGMICGSSAGVFLASVCFEGSVGIRGALGAYARFVRAVLLTASVVWVLYAAVMYAGGFGWSSTRLAASFGGLAIAITTSVSLALAPISSAVGNHRISVASGLIPNAFALICVSTLSVPLKAYSYPIGWVSGAVVTIYMAICSVKRASMFKTSEITTSQPRMLHLVSNAPAFAMFGMHQFLDGSVLARVSLHSLPLAAFAQRIIVSLGNICASGFVSLTTEDFSRRAEGDLPVCIRRLQTRCCWLVAAAGICGLIVYFTAPVVGSTVRLFAPFGPEIIQLFDVAPAYALGAGFMLATVVASRALLLLGRRKVLIGCAGVVALTYSAVLAIFAGKHGLAAVAVGYLISWAIAATTSLLYLGRLARI